MSIYKKTLVFLSKLTRYVLTALSKLILGKTISYDITGCFLLLFRWVLKKIIVNFRASFSSKIHSLPYQSCIVFCIRFRYTVTINFDWKNKKGECKKQSKKRKKLIAQVNFNRIIDWYKNIKNSYRVDTR